MARKPIQQPISMALLESVLSKPRLDGYRRSADDTPRTVIGRYRWNLALSRALYEELHLLEVAFRNRLHGGLTHHFRGEAWFDQPWLSAREKSDVSAIKKRLQGDGNPGPDRVVAELDFGFWTSLLSSFYDQVIWNQRELLTCAFPHMPRRWRNRWFLSSVMNPLRKLRNRVFHHEPIWRSVELPQRHNELRQMLRWLAPQVLDVLSVSEPFEDVYARGSGAYESEVDG